MTALDSINSGIAAIDTALDVCRALWLNPKDDAEKAKMHERLNGLLDQRLGLMKQRDNLMLEQTPH